MKSIIEHNFTSTGTKFWCHPKQMNSYLVGSSNSIISTHISPEGSCNLNCTYCSVKKRKRNYRIELDVIKDYVNKLCSRGLKAVILTGGGCPVLYPQFNELTRWIKSKGLSIALITNGTNSKKVDNDVWGLFSWIRVSVNLFDGWANKIFIPKNKLSKNCILGASFIYDNEPGSIFYEIENHANSIGCQYVRVLPNCLLKQENLLKQHNKIDKILEKMGSSIFFHQFKIHGAPKSKICHQAYFRPYLSEVDGGTVFPCDSLVLNDNIEHFNGKYQICRASQVLDFLDGKIKMKFDVQKDCTGCVFTDNINMLDDWKKNQIKPKSYKENLIHKDFI